VLETIDVPGFLVRGCEEDVKRAGEKMAQGQGSQGSRTLSLVGGSRLSRTISALRPYLVKSDLESLRGVHLEKISERSCEILGPRGWR